MIYPGPLCCGERAQDSPQGRGQDARESVAGPWMDLQPTPEPAREVCAQGCAQTAAWGVLSFWLLVSLHKQRKSDSASAGGRKLLLRRDNRKSLDPRFRGDDGFL